MWPLSSRIKGIHSPIKEEEAERLHNLVLWFYGDIISAPPNSWDYQRLAADRDRQLILIDRYLSEGQ